jgi:glycosyltransferase involved in cell wall biosynthesis
MTHRICFVYKEDYPWDVRVEKIVKSCVGNGKSVVLLCRNLKRLSRSESDGSFTIERLPTFGGRLLNQLLTAPFFLNPIWVFYIFKCVIKNNCDSIIVRDLPLMLSAIFVGRALRVKVIFDMAECYPEMYRSLLQHGAKRRLNYLLKNPCIYEWIECAAVRWCDHVFVMIEESRDRLMRKRVRGDKISIVSNTPSLNNESFANREYRRKDELSLLYVGFVTELRGIDTVLRGLAHYYAQAHVKQRICLTVIGVGGATKQLKALSETLGVQRYVEFLGWCEKTVVDRFYASADVGLLPYKWCSHWNATIPNKLFDYMIAGIPVLASNIVPIQRIIEEARCGLVFEDGDIGGFVRCVDVLTDHSKREELGLNGRQAIRAKYNWENDNVRLLGALNRI